MLLGCNPKEILEPVEEIPFEYPAFAVIDGETVKTRNDKDEWKRMGKNDKKGLFQISIVGDTVLIYKEPKNRNQINCQIY